MIKSHQSRLEKLDKLSCIKKPSPPLFKSWSGNSWTEEEKEKAIRAHPDQHMFWKALSETVPTEGNPRFAAPKKREPSEE